MLVHYIPGLIESIDPIVESIRKWFDGEGRKVYVEPWVNTQSTGNADGPLARITSGCVTIETWKMKYDRRENSRRDKNHSSVSEDSIL